MQQILLYNWANELLAKLNIYTQLIGTGTNWKRFKTLCAIIKDGILETVIMQETDRDNHYFPRSRT